MKIDTSTMQYKELNGQGIAVYLSGKRVGTIESVNGRNGFTYFPAGSRKHGDVFPSVWQVKKSLEAE